MQLYRQAIPAIGLSMERATDQVPKDGFFYVLLHGEIKGRFRTKSKALSLYRALLEQSGHKPQPVQVSVDAARENVERYLDELESYWSDSHTHSKRGGKGRY